MSTPSAMEIAPSDFIRDVVAADLRAQNVSKIRTRFPPEPNGYLHLGHAKSICLNVGVAREFAGICNLRMDYTNPTKEQSEYVESIREDVDWLIRGWADKFLALKAIGQPCAVWQIDGKGDSGPAPLNARPNDPHAADHSPEDAAESEPFYASDYFDQMLEYALDLIAKGKAYVDDLSPEDTDS